MVVLLSVQILLFIDSTIFSESQDIHLGLRDGYLDFRQLIRLP